MLLQSLFTVLFHFVIINCANYTSPSQNQSFTLKSNLITNPNISTPVISPAYYANYPNNISGWTTKVLNVEYIDPCLEQKSNMLACPSFKGVTCGWQFLDTDSTNSNEQYYQRFTLSAGLQFQLKFDWISEISYLSKSTGFSVIWNGVTIESTYDNSCTLKTSTYYLTSIEGVNQVVFAGIGFVDSAGILIRNVQLQQLVYTSNTTTNYTNNTTSINSTSNSTIVTNDNSTSIDNRTNNTANNANSTQNVTMNTNNTINTNNTENTTNTNSLAITNSTTNAKSSDSSLILNSQDQIPSDSTLTDNSSDTPINSNTNDFTINSTTNLSNNSSNDTKYTQSNTTNDARNSNTTSNSSNDTTNSYQANQTNNTNSQNNTNTADYNNSNDIMPWDLPQNNGYTFDTLQNSLNDSQLQNVFKIYNFIKKFQITKLLNTLSALKQNAKFIFGLVLEFNHLLLYNYHLLNYTLMSNVILAGMQGLDDQKGSILDTYIYPLLGTSPQEINSGFQQQNQLPVNIGNIVTDFMQRPNGILLQFSDLFCLDFPITLLTFIIGFIFFKLLFRWRISIVLRQYSLFGFFFYLLFDGKIQILTFYYLSELLLLVNTNFQQKWKTTAIIFIYFIVFLVAVASMFLYRIIYGQLTKYIYQNCKNPTKSIFHMTFGYGLYNILLGFTHRMLLQFPMLQLYVLIGIETTYLIYLLIYLARCNYNNSALGVTLLSMNFARLIFIITFFVYQMYPETQDDVSVVQEYFFYTFLLLWLLSSLLSIIQKITVFCKALTFSCRHHHQLCNRIVPLSFENSPSKSQQTTIPRSYLANRSKYNFEANKLRLWNYQDRYDDTSPKQVLPLKANPHQIMKNSIKNVLLKPMTSRKRRVINATTHKTIFNIVK